MNEVKPETRMQLIGYRQPTESAEPEQPVLVEYVCHGRVAVVANSPTAVQAVKHAVQMGQGEPVEQAIAVMMDEHWRSVVHPDRVEGILAFNEEREPKYADPDF